MERKLFEPFQDRLSRDIRNDLSKSLVKVIEKRMISPAESIAEHYLQADLEQCYIEYIRDRLAAYKAFLRRIKKVPQQSMWQAFILWDLKLFFEVHEILEHEWLKTQGDEKMIIQAMIRAAGVYIKLEYGYRDSAVKIADRAIPVLEKHKDYLARYFDPQKLLLCLKDLSQPPPVLLDNFQKK